MSNKPLDGLNGDLPDGSGRERLYIAKKMCKHAESNMERWPTEPHVLDVYTRVRRSRTLHNHFRRSIS